VRVAGHVYGYSERGGWICFDLKKGGAEPVWRNRASARGR
jgi:outer membrane protein assembly factor BamB